jgi:hypothetical protein
MQQQYVRIYICRKSLKSVSKFKQCMSTWTFTTRIGGNLAEELTEGSSTNRAIWSTFRGDKKTSTPNG